MRSILPVMVLLLLCEGAVAVGAAETFVFDENDILSRDTGPVGTAAVPAPDIAVLIFDPPSGAVERTFTILNAVRNGGTAQASVFPVEFYLSSDSKITTADILIGSRSHSGFGAGIAGPVENTTVTVPDSVPAGPYYLGIIIDSTNAVDEALEINNILYFTPPITVPDLAVVQVPGGAGLPTDADGDGKYNDVNGNGRKDFADVVWLFNNF